jgi:hypothetical protein
MNTGGQLRHFTKWLFAAGYLLALLSFAAITDAQTAESPAINGVMVRWTNERSELWYWNADGTYSLATDISDLPYPNTVGDIKLSPNRQLVAFTSSLGRESTPQLYVVSLNSQKIKQYQAPGVASIHWSPNTDALLLLPPSIFVGGSSEILWDGDTYVFDLTTETFTLVAETTDQQTVWNAKWSPSGDAIIYSQTIRERRFGLDLPDIYRVTRDGSSRQQLTDLNVQAHQLIDFSQPPERHSCDITNFKWLATNARWYYVLNCRVLDGDTFVSSLFSVNMDGNNRLEVDLYEHFPQKYDPYEGLWFGYEVTDFFPTADGVYLVVNSPDFKVLILNVPQPGQTQVVAEIPSFSGRLAAISENDSNVTVIMRGGTGAIINLTSGQVQTLSTTGADYSLCHAQWLNDEVVLVDQVRLCGILNETAYTVNQVIGWNIYTGNQGDMTAQFEGGLNIILLPQEVP